MDYNRNADKFLEDVPGISFNQVIDVDNTAAVSAELFSVNQFKAFYGKIDNSDEDSLIESLIIAARRMCEQYAGINFKARTVVATINNLNGGTYLPYGPVGTVASVTDIDGNAIESGNYKITGSQFKQIQWPTSDYLVVTYTGGYADCPNELLTAVKAQVLFLYENRGDSSVGMSPQAAMILNPLKRR